MEVAAGCVAGLADPADLLAGVHPLSLPGPPTPQDVHVHVVVAIGASVDDEVVAGAARVVAAVLHASAAGGDQRLAALGEDVLPLVAPPRTETVVVGMAGADRELLRIELEGAVVALGPAAIDLAAVLGADPEEIGALLGCPAVAVAAGPADLVRARLDVLASPHLHDPPVASPDRLDLEIAGAVAVDRVPVDDGPLTVEEGLPRSCGLGLQQDGAIAAGFLRSAGSPGSRRGRGRLIGRSRAIGALLGGSHARRPRQERGRRRERDHS